jgi:hypothetical protein
MSDAEKPSPDSPERPGKHRDWQKLPLNWIDEIAEYEHLNATDAVQRVYAQFYRLKFEGPKPAVFELLKTDSRDRLLINLVERETESGAVDTFLAVVYNRTANDLMSRREQIESTFYLGGVHSGYARLAKGTYTMDPKNEFWVEELPDTMPPIITEGEDGTYVSVYNAGFDLSAPQHDLVGMSALAFYEAIDNSNQVRDLLRQFTPDMRIG